MKIFIKLLAFFNMAEGFIHLVVALVSIWGIIDESAWDIRILTAPLSDLLFGIFSIFTGYYLNESSDKLQSRQRSILKRKRENP